MRAGTIRSEMGTGSNTPESRYSSSARMYEYRSWGVHSAETVDWAKREMFRQWSTFMASSTREARARATTTASSACVPTNDTNVRREHSERAASWEGSGTSHPSMLTRLSKGQSEGRASTRCPSTSQSERSSVCSDAPPTCSAARIPAVVSDSHEGMER